MIVLTDSENFGPFRFQFTCAKKYQKKAAKKARARKSKDQRGNDVTRSMGERERRWKKPLAFHVLFAHVCATPCSAASPVSAGRATLCPSKVVL